MNIGSNSTFRKTKWQTRVIPNAVRYGKVTTLTDAAADCAGFLTNTIEQPSGTITSATGNPSAEMDTFPSAGLFTRATNTRFGSDGQERVSAPRLSALYAARLCHLDIRSSA